MKKETIEKLFKRYISIFDNVTNQTTGKHLDQTIVNEINSEVDLLFKEYEQISNLTEFNSFSEKIQNIINKVLKESKLLNKAFIEKELQKRFDLFENNPFIYIENEVNNTIKKMVPTVNGDYYIPYNPYLQTITKKGYNAVYKFDKIQEHIKEIEPKIKAEKEHMSLKTKEEYKEVLKTALNEINDYPIQFCEETIQKYFYNDEFIEKLLVFPNSIKNQIIFEAININSNLHTFEYEKSLNSIFVSNAQYKISDNNKLYNLKPNYLSDFKYNFYTTNNLISRIKLIDKFLNIYCEIYYKNKGLSKNQKISLNKKLDIVLNNIDNLFDVSIIRFYKLFMLEQNLYYLKGAPMTDTSTSLLAYNIMNINLTILINELKTIKLVDANYILNNKYINIINEYYEYIEKNKDTVDDNYNNLKISILNNLIEIFDKQYKYKYILENIKLKFKKFKNIIKIKKN